MTNLNPDFWRQGMNEKSIEVFTSFIGKTIASLSLGGDEVLHRDVLRFTFGDGTKMMISDEGQNCCEERYMRTDAKLESYVGAKLLDAEVADAPPVEDEHGCRDVQFLHVKTDRGTFTMSTHNEHNGYYAGFCVAVRAE